MKNSIVILLLTLLISCKQEKFPEFTKLGRQYFRIVELGEDRQIQSGDFIQSYLSIENLAGDSLHYVPDYPYFFQIKDTEIDSLFKRLHLKDSAVFIVDPIFLKNYFSSFHFTGKSESPLKLKVRILGIYDTVLSSGRAMDLMLDQRKNREGYYLHELLTEVNGKLDTLEQGLYRQIIQEGEGQKIGLGSFVTVDYRGMFANGYEFENSKKSQQFVSFIYGEQFQLLQGINIGLKERKEGDKLKIFLSSQHGYGDKGSIAGIVPPYTALVYEIEIKKVKN